MLEQIQKKHILIDGDIVKYRCAASAEKTLYKVLYKPDPDSYAHIDAENHKDAIKKAEEWNGEIWNRKEIQPLEFALQACKTTIESLVAKLAPSNISIFLSPQRNFRDDIARTKPYKGNRTQPKPKYLKACEEYLVREYGATVGVNVEADDEIGVALSKNPTGAVSVSIDKDLLQVPGWHYNWVNDTVRRVSDRDGDFAFYTQMLQGDTTDNIPGIAGIGEIGARKILHGAKSSAELCSRVWMCYRGEFNDTQKALEYFVEQAQLLWILRDNPRRPGHSQQYIPPIELK